MSLMARPRWTRQPQGAVQIDWSNPLTRGLVICTHAGNNFLELVNNKPSTITSATYAPTKEGRALMDGASTFRIQTPASASFGAAVTWLVGARLDTFPANPSRFIEKADEEIFLIRSTGVFEFQRLNTALVAAQTIGASTGQTAPAPYSTYAVRVGDFTTNLNAAMFVNGVSQSLTINTSGTGTLNTTANLYLLGNRSLLDRQLDGRLYFAYRWNRALSDNEIKSISANPWSIFKPVTRTIGAVISGVTISRPNSDITTTGWTGNPDNVTLYANIDEVTPSDTDFIISPTLSGTPGPATFGISPTLSAGTYNIRLRAKRTATSGDIRALLLDSSGTTVGTSAWQTVTGSFAAYTLSVTTTGTAARVRLEVRA